MEENFIEANPALCKSIMKEVRLLENNLRLPLIPFSKELQKKLKAIWG